MSGPVVPFLEVTEVDGSPSGRPITKLIVSNGDLSISGTTATIDTTGGGSSSLTATYVGFGSSSNTLTGAAGFIWSETAQQLKISSDETADDSVMLHLDTNTFDGTMLLVESGKAHGSGTGDDGPNIEIYRSATGANGKYIGSFLVTGLNALDEKKEWFKIQNYISDSSGNEDSLVIFKALNNGVDDDFMRLRGGAGVIINDNGRATIDFRVQTSSSDYGFFVDAGQSGVSINGNYDTTIKSTPKLQILSQTGVASYAYLASSGSSPESLTNDELQGPIYSHISSSAHTYALPTGVKGMQFQFFSNDGNISIEPQPTDKINGGSSGATSTFSTNHQIYTCICYDTNEWVVSPPT